MAAMLSDLPSDARDKIDMTSALKRLIEHGTSPITAIEYDGR